MGGILALLFSVIVVLLMLAIGSGLLFFSVVVL